MTNIKGQVDQLCPFQEHNQPERGCQLAKGVGNGRVFCCQESSFGTLTFLKLTLQESHLHIADYGVASLDGF